MTDPAPVAAKIVAKLRLVCLELPEAYEESAWVGTRWGVQKRTFAHVLRIEAGWPPAYARAAGSDGPLTVLTFRSSVSKLETPRFGRAPFFKPVWWPNIVGIVIDERVDWDEVGDLLIASYCLLAPRKLVKLVDRSIE